MSTILGIDEAGRGAVVGPLVMACAVVDTEQYSYLTSIGVKDSKAFKRDRDPRKKRKTIAEKLMQSLPYNIYRADVRTIDGYVKNHQLDNLEREQAKCLIKWALGIEKHMDEVVMDSSQMFGQLAEQLSRLHPNIKFTAMDKADDKIKAVSAASIIAKNDRDTIVQQIMGEKAFSNGAGYPNLGTEGWIRSWYEYKDYPFMIDINPITCIRQSWKWWTKLTNKLDQEMKMNEIINTL